MARRKTVKKSDTLVYALLIMLLVASSAWLLANAIGPSHMGDDINAYIWEAHRAAAGTFQETSADIFSVRLLQDLPIGFFYWMLGPGIISSALWDIISFLLSIVIVFFLGKELYDAKVGLVAAFLMATFSMAVIYSLTMSDNLPMMLFGTLAMYLLISGLKRDSARRLFASGIAFVAIPLTTPEGAVLIVVALAYLVLLVAFNRKARTRTIMYLFFGAALALALLMLYNYADSGNAFITLTATEHFYGSVGQQDTIPYIDSSPTFYITIMFPYGVLNGIWRIATGANPLQVLGSYEWVWTNDSNLSGLFFYFMVLASIFLIAKRDRRAIFPLFWFVAGFLYLEFGPMSISFNPLSFHLLHRLDRFLLLIAPPVAVVISAAMITAIRETRKRLRPLTILLCVAVVLLMLSVSFSIIWFVHEEMAAEQYPILTEAKYLMQFPNTTKIYMDGGYADLEVYMGFNNFSRFFSTNPEATSCNSLPVGSYMLIPSPAARGGYSGPYGFTINDIANCSSSWQLVLEPSLSSFPPEFRVNPSLSLLYHVGPYNSTVSVSSSNSAVNCSGSTVTRLSLYGTGDNITGCDFSNATIYAYGNGTNRIICPEGNFSIKNLSSSSSIEIWYCITFVPHDSNGQVDNSFPNIIDAWAQSNNASMDFKPSYSQQRVFPGIYTLPVETELISKSGTTPYNPYVFMVPDWGHDILTTYHLNVTRNVVLQPDFAMPYNISIYSIYPMTFNAIQFLVLPFDLDPANAMMLSGVQFSHPTVVENYTITGNELINYTLPNKPGFYSYLMEINGNGEIDNTTTMTFSKGITYCAPFSPYNQGLDRIGLPGYYPFASSSPHPLRTYNYTVKTFNGIYAVNGAIAPFLTNATQCSYGFKIMASNVTVDCRNGFVNASLFGFNITDSRNVTIANCSIYGSNGIIADNSEVNMLNDTIYSTPNVISQNSIINILK